jgi:hypothetical protein
MQDLARHERRVLQVQHEVSDLGGVPTLRREAVAHGRHGITSTFTSVNAFITRIRDYG